MSIVVTPDSFKGSLTADEAAAAIAGGVGRVLPDAEVLLRPVADGGEGTVAAALRARAWLWRERSVCRLSRSRTRGSSLLTR